MPQLDLPGGAIEYRLIDGHPTREPLVFLHEGLGCAATWSGFPDIIAAATGRRGLVHSRHGYGASAPMPVPRSMAYLHDEADHVLPALLDRLALRNPILVGHSDGASIALLYAARQPTAGVVAIAPHVFVEPETLAGIDDATARYTNGDLAARLAMFHDDAATVFRSWADTWRSPAFAEWNIEDRLPDIACPTLLIQGTADQYATMRQLDAIEKGVSGRTARVELPACGHSPHLEAPTTTAGLITPFVLSL